MSGRSSRSTLIFTKWAFINAATVESSNDSRSITWHQWQDEYPILIRRSLFSALALASASSPQGNQSTGLWACCNRYGLVSWMSRLVWACDIWVLFWHPVTNQVDRKSVV